AELAHEDEAARAREEVLRHVSELEQEARDAADRFAHVAQNEEARLVASSRAANEPERHAARPHGSAESPVRIHASARGTPPPDALASSEALHEETHRAPHLLDLALVEGGEGPRQHIARGARGG